MVRVFVSYSWRDKAFVSRLVSDLKKRNVGVRMDDFALRVGEPMFMKVHEEIITADYLVVVLSKKSICSRWVGIELAMAINKELKHERPFILPALVEKCDIPLYLFDRKWADFRTDYVFGLRGLLSVILDGKKER